jgi:hypothetical protein
LNEREATTRGKLELAWLTSLARRLDLADFVENAISPRLIVFRDSVNAYRILPALATVSNYALHLSPFAPAPPNLDKSCSLIAPCRESRLDCRRAAAHSPHTYEYLLHSADFSADTSATSGQLPFSSDLPCRRTTRDGFGGLEKPDELYEGPAGEQRSSQTISCLVP